MPDYEKAAERAAKKYGIDPAIFKAQIRQESGFRMGVKSSAGAQDIAQFIPSTAKQYGVTLGDGRASDDLDGAARYMRDNLDRTGDDYAAALSIYNSGRPDAYKDPNFAGGQTYNYVKTILGAAKVKAPKTSAPKQKVTAATQTTTTPGVDNSALRRQLVGQFLQHGGVTNPARSSRWRVRTVRPRTFPGRRRHGHQFGRLASYANQRFGMSNQPWCAMFTSLAVTKGGAPKTARTASVAEVRRQAEQGGGGYQHGFVSRPNTRRPGT
jgi:hypothetical protein